jgi:hypothetical protein
MKKLWSCLLFFNLLSLIISGQADYISTDTSTTSGIKLIDGGEILNSRFCQVKVKQKIVQYSPLEIHEFGFTDGRVYISKEIKLTDSSERVFLERLSSGRINLYYYKSKGSKIYILEKDSAQYITFRQSDINSISYKDQLLGITEDCPYVRNVIKFVGYNKKSLSEIITRYNNCDLQPFPHIRYGLVAGYEISIPNPGKKNSNDYIDYFDWRNDGGFAAGLFIDNPIAVSDFSLHTEIYYSRHGYSYYKLIDKKDIDFVANISSLKLPVLLRYSYPSNKYRPFINAGAMMTFKTRNEYMIMETTVLNKTAEINYTHTPLPGKFQKGYSIGTGLEICINSQRSVFLEARFNKQYDYAGVLHESYINFMAGINF